MARVTIVTGSPGTGKTTLSELLARQDARGIHLRSDVFYTFPAHPIDPTKPESRAQNTAIIVAVAGAAGGFAEAGWPVVLDGIFGPWFLPELLRALPRGLPVEYLVLRSPLEEALRRVRERDGPGPSAKVEHMHRAFSDLGPYAAHALESSGEAPEALLSRFVSDRARFALSR